MQIKVRPLVHSKLGELLEALLAEGYFATEKYALAYVKEIRSAIQRVPGLRHFQAKDTSFGQYYASYKPNGCITFFRKEESR